MGLIRNRRIVGRGGHLYKTSWGIRFVLTLCGGCRYVNDPGLLPWLPNQAKAGVHLTFGFGAPACYEPYYGYYPGYTCHYHPYWHHRHSGNFASFGTWKLRNSCILYSVFCILTSVFCIL